jgi:hypothetical protein
MSKFRYLNSQEVEDYGAEFLDVVDKVAAGRTEHLREQLWQVQGEPAQERRQRTAEQLRRRMPHFDAWNNDPGLLEWLKHPDPASGRVRQDLLTEAFNMGDVDRVEGFFRAFEALPDPTKPTGTPCVQPLTASTKATRALISAPSMRYTRRATLCRQASHADLGRGRPSQSTTPSGRNTRAGGPRPKRNRSTTKSRTPLIGGRCDDRPACHLATGTSPHFRRRLQRHRTAGCVGL